MIRTLWDKFGPQFVRFFVVGVGATIVHWGVYVLLNYLFELKEEQKVALTITYTLGYIISFVGNYIASLKWTFKTNGSVSKGAGFMFSHLVNYGMHVGLLNLFLLLGVGEFLVSALQFCAPWLVELVPAMGNAANLLPLPVFAIVVPINFLLVRFFLTRGDTATQ
ncbi:MAG: GtrA family protein [Akkermansia sp.]|nr:GtrA family protein [Akkermansia sp.]